MINAAGISAAEFSRRTGVSDSGVSKWLNGTRSPTLDNLFAVGKATGQVVSIQVGNADAALAVQLSRVEHLLRPEQRVILAAILADCEQRAAEAQSNTEAMLASFEASMTTTTTDDW